MRKNHCSRSRIDHQVARALAGAVGEHLLVGQHRLAAGAPVDRGVGPVGQAGVQQAQEDDLVPMDVGRVVAADLPPPVVDGTQAVQRLLQLGDAGLGEDPRMGARLDGRVLGRQAERVEAEGREHGLALHGLVPDHQVAEGVVAHVALVGRAGRVGVHAEGVEGRSRVVVVDLVGPLVAPALLPLALDRLDVVGPCHRRVMLPPVGPGPARPGGWRRTPKGGPERRPRERHATGLSRTAVRAWQRGTR